MGMKEVLRVNGIRRFRAALVLGLLFAGAISAATEKPMNVIVTRDR